MEHRYLRITCRIVALGCIVALAVLSLTPSDRMVRTDLGGQVEHVIGYAGTAFIAAVAFAERGLIRLTLALCIYAGVLEFLQRFSPGRTSSIVDFLFSSTGVVIGVGVFAVLRRIRPYHFGNGKR